MHRIYEAIKFADKRHKGQKRKGSGLAYITHPIAVSYLLAQYKVSKHLVELIVACILHDVLEDTDTLHTEITKKFGPLVASLCHELTNDAAEIALVGKLAYQTKKVLGISSWALVCKLVDRLHNIMDRPTQKTLADTLVLLDKLRKGRKLSKTHLRIMADIEAECRKKLHVA
jgi:(p)ppGpp synthase/HD superfamily hydrolase